MLLIFHSGHGRTKEERRQCRWGSNVVCKNRADTDLDNTLFDWVEIWLNCFSPMLDKLIELSAVPKENLIPEIADVHQKHGTSEYSFLIDELPSLRTLRGNQPAITFFAPAIDVYREERRKWLKLFPTVAETLLKIKGRGTIIVGYTESMAFYSNYRLRRLGLDGVLDYVFCPRDHLLPAGLSPEDLRKYPAEHYELRYTKQDFTPEGSKKPDTAVLNGIISDLSLKKSECVFVGDSLMKDVAMPLTAAFPMSGQSTGKLTSDQNTSSCKT